MTIALVVLASIVALAGWVLSLAGISGSWLLLAAGIGADLAFDGRVDFIVSSIVFGVLCVAAEVVEFLSGLLGAKTFGGSRWAQVGAFVGTLVGGIVGAGIFPIVGTIIGAVLGGFAGSLTGEIVSSVRSKGGKQAVTSGMKAGLGAMLARVLSIAMKVVLSTLMLTWYVVIVVSGFVEGT